MQRYHYRGHDFSLHECPQCGDEAIITFSDEPQTRIQILCPSCGFDAATCATIEEAVADWNLNCECATGVDFSTSDNIHTIDIF